MREAQALGFDMLKDNGTGKNGTFIADVTDPLHPKTVGFVEVGQGSHNQSIHPSGNYLYNSNSDLITSFQPAIEMPRKANWTWSQRTKGVFIIWSRSSALLAPPAVAAQAGGDELVDRTPEMVFEIGRASCRERV